PYLLPILAGTAMIGLGRLRMVALPPDTGASGVLVGAAILTVIRALALLTATGFIVMAGIEHRQKNPVGADEYTDLFAGALMIAAGLRVVLALQTGYTYLHYSLYAAGQAGASGDERAR